MIAPPPQITGPRDLHEALDVLKPLGWEKSLAFVPSIWRPVGERGQQRIEPDVPGSGRFVLRGNGVPLGGFRGTLVEVLEYVKKMEGA